MTSTSEVNGKCKTIFADKGDIIPTSGALAELDTTFIRLEIEANKIARLQAQRKLDQEKKTLARYTVLKDKNSTSEATFDEVALNVDLYTYNLQKLKIEETHLLEQLARHVIMAPPGWRVIERFAEPGEYIQAGTAIARLGDFRSLLIRLAVTYDELQSLKELKTIPLILPEIAQTVDAALHQTSPVFDAKTRKIPIELIITAPRIDQTVFLRGGMRAELVFKTTFETDTYLVPLSALISRYEAHWLVQPDGTKLLLATNIRLRPILLTTLTTTLGLLPMALGIPEYSIIWGSMAMTFVTGLCTATVLTILVVPVQWDLLRGLDEMLKKRKQRKNNLKTL
jgi:membrane fusion protein (multidrug efflux system)